FHSHGPASTVIYTLSLHDALPISRRASSSRRSPRPALAVSTPSRSRARWWTRPISRARARSLRAPVTPLLRPPDVAARRRAEHRSEEHTSELQSRFDLVCRLLLEK